MDFTTILWSVGADVVIRRPHWGQQPVRLFRFPPTVTPSWDSAPCGPQRGPPRGSPPPVSEISWCQGQEYTTLGPNFYIFSVLSPRICFCFVNPYLLAGIAAFFEILLLAVSRHDLKRSIKSWIIRPRSTFRPIFIFFMNFCPQRATFLPTFMFFNVFLPLEGDFSAQLYF